MRLLRIALFAVLFCVSGIVLFSQTSPNLENGFKPYGSYDGTGIDTVNLLNGNLMLHVPMPYQYSQRGQIQPISLLTISSKQWMLDCWDVGSDGGQFCQWDNGPVFNVPANAGIGTDFGLNTTMAISRVWQTQTVPGFSVTYSANNYVLYTADGASHFMSDGPGDGNGHELSLDELAPGGYHVDFTAWDDTQNGIPTAGIVIDRKGNRYPFAGFGGPCRFFMDTLNNISTTTCNQASYLGPLETDANGNSITTSTDTLGRPLSASLLAFNQLSTTSDMNGCTNASSAKVFSYTGINGTSNQMKKCFANVAINTAFSQTPSNKQITGSVTMVTGVVLPDGTNWNFQYDNYGNVTHIGMPLGGTITYIWQEIAQPPCGGNTDISRAVSSRTLNDNNNHSFTWNYSWGGAVNGVITNVVTDPAGNDTIHIFTNLADPNGTGCLYYETTTAEYQGNYNANRPLRRVDTQYSDPKVSPGIVVPKSIQTTVYPSGKVSLITKTYAGTTFATQVLGNVATEKQYDWGQSSAGPLIREIDTTYQWDVDSRYLTARFLDLPASVIVKDGAGNRVSETDYLYDEYSLQAHTGTLPTGTSVSAPNPAPVRGNLTTVSKWLNTGGTVVTHTKWYDTGMPYQKIDAMGHTTQFTYDSAYAGAYTTQTCSPQTGSVTHCVTGTYDFTTGLITSLSNENATTPASGNTPGDDAHTSKYTYDTIMPRITFAKAPPDPSNSGARAQTSFNYPPNPPTFPYAVTRQKSITTGITDSSTTTFDGLGRVYKSQHVLPGGTAEVDTTFEDTHSQVIVTNPYFSTADPTYGSTTTLSDGLGRATQVSKQDGSVSKVAYSVQTTIAVNGDCTQTTDEAGNQRGSCSDALGRLVEVDEPNPGNPINVNNKATLVTDGNFVLENAVGTGIWSTGTSGTNATSIYMQDDGNLVLYVFKWSAGTYATPSPGPFSANACSIGTSYLMVNQRLNAYQCIVSPHGQYLLYMGSDGNFYIYDVAHNVGTWGPGTYGHPGAYAIMQGDGNLCVYTATNTYLWCSGTGGTNADRLNMEDDGRIIIYKSAWNSGTGGQPYGSAMAHPGCDVGNSGLGSTGILGSGSCLVSPNGRFDLLMQGDGNLVIYDRSVTPNAVLWSTGTATSGADPGYAMRTLYSYDALGNLLRVEQHGDTTDSTKWRIRTFTYDSLSRLLTATNPESGTITYSYDADGNLLQKTSPAPNQTGTATQTVSYCYDALHRITGKGYGAQSCPLATPIVTYAYDLGTNAIGKLTSLTDQAGTASYTYDILGRLTAETRTLTGANNASISKNLSYEYNLDGSLYKLHYPSGNVVTYEAGAAGLTLSAKDSGNNINYATSATYGPDSALTGFTSGYSTTFAGITNKFLYTPRLQPCRMIAATSGTLPTLCGDAAHGNVLDLGYDFHLGNGTSGTDNGNVYGITNYKDQTRNQTFTYDTLNRLASARNAGTDCTATVLGGLKKFWGNNYSYDAWGNLIGKSLLQTPAPPACAGENLSLTADSHNWIHANGGADYQYDAAGNMTFNATAPTQTYTYDQENRLTGAAGYSYTYDSDGNRVRKSNSSSTGTLYWYMTPGIVGESDLSGNLTDEYVFFDGERVARKSTNGVFYYFADHLKTASAITDSSGNIKSESDFYPWGGELQFVNNDSNHYKFTGKERDGETQLDYFGARYYSNALGRFVTPDWGATPEPVPYADPVDPQTLNQHSYVRNIPTTRYDADGHDGGTGAAVWEILTDGAELSGPLWRVGSVALPGLIGGVVVTGEIQYAANTIQIKTNAETQYQVTLNNLAVLINQMARAGKSTEQLRREWEKLTGQKWPKDPATGANQDAHHKDAKADGGTDAAENIEPKPHADHVDHHKKNGDFKRWGKRAHQKPPEPPKPEPPKPEPPKPEPPPEPKPDTPK